MSKPSLFHPDDATSVLPDALDALADLRSRGLTHRYVRHVRSSQAFALNLFAPLDDDGVRQVFYELGQPEMATVERPVFEYEDTADRLQEASARSRHRTQVDVVLRGTTTSGQRVAALIEVKLGETNFGECSAFTSADNPGLEVCAQPGLFGGEPDRCFQIANHGRGHRRYAEFLTDVPLTPPPARADDGGCWVRTGRSQPMRNLAMAHVMATEDDADEVVFALCAPIAHKAMWRRWDEFTSLFSDTDHVTIRPLQAESVAAAHSDAGAAFIERYKPAMSDAALLHLSIDGQRLLGVWLHRDGHLTSFYDVDTEADSSYAEGLVVGGNWVAQLERLANSLPYFAWWQAIHCPLTENIEDLFDRLTRDYFATT